MSTPSDPNLALIEAAVASLGSLIEELTLVGGATAGLLITDPAALRVRETVDVDLVVQAASYVEYDSFGRRLAQRGFERGNREGDPICRWRRGEVVLDIMPLDEKVLGFSSRWYESAIGLALTRKLPSGATIQHIDAPHFAATKLDAFRSRGEGDFAGSSDLEDLVRVVDGRREIEDEFARAPRALREFVGAVLAECTGDRFFVEALPEYFVGREEGRVRARIVIERLRRMIDVSTLGDGS